MLYNKNKTGIQMIKAFKKTKQIIQKGFSLLEVAIVVTLLGILVTIVAPYIMGGMDESNGTNIITQVQKSFTNIAVLSAKCQTTTAYTGNPVPNTASLKTMVDVIYGGYSNVAAAYQTCYLNSKISPLSEAAVNNSGWKLLGYTVTFGGGGAGVANTITLAAVKSNVALNIVQRYSPSTSSLAIAGSAGPVTWTADSGSGSDLTFSKQL